MRMCRLLYGFAFLSLFAAVAGADNKQQEGKNLIDRAIQLSDIRGIGAPAFRMKATFRMLSGPSTDRGSYSEVWASNERWRRETGIGSFRRVEVGGANKKWLSDNGEVIPPGAAEIVRSLNLAGAPKQLKIKQVVNKDLGGVAARCVRSETEFEKEMYCVDPKDNTILLRESRSRSSHSSYVYRDYEKFGDHLFPRSLQYRREGEPGVEIDISELSPEPSPDPSQFAPLVGALELGNCLPDEMTPPHVEYAPDPHFPAGVHTDGGLVVLSLIVGMDDKPHNIQVARSGGTEFDSEAVRAVGLWRFRPSKCRGEPVSELISIEVAFRRYTSLP
jgi:hypothetical protein